MKIFNTSKNSYILAMKDLNTKQTTHLYNDGNKYLIRINKDGVLCCNRCLGNITENLSSKTLECAILNKWGI